MSGTIKVPNHTIREMRKLYEASDISITDVAKKFDLDYQYVQKVLDYTTRRLV